MWGLMLASYTPTICVNPFPTAFMRIGISVHTQVDSLLNKTRQLL